MTKLIPAALLSAVAAGILPTVALAQPQQPMYGASQPMFGPVASAQPAFAPIPNAVGGPALPPAAYGAPIGPDFLPPPPGFMGPPRPGYLVPPYPPIPPNTAVWAAPQPPLPRGDWWHGAMIPYPHQRVVYYPTWDTPGHRPVGVWAPEVPQAAVPAFWKRHGQGEQSPP